jgi:hypothetical protein
MHECGIELEFSNGYCGNPLALPMVRNAHPTLIILMAEYGLCLIIGACMCLVARTSSPW